MNGTAGWSRTNDLRSHNPRPSATIEVFRDFSAGKPQGRNQALSGVLSNHHSASDELRSIARAIERLGCRMGEDPERAILRKEALADRVRAVAAQIGGAA